MSESCQHIASAINYALEAGNKIYRITAPDHENKKLIVDLCDPLTSRLKNVIDEQCVELRYWEWVGVPHNPPEKGYTCDKCNIVLIFPNQLAKRL